MSVFTSNTSSHRGRRFLAVVAITASASVGLTIAAPGTGAFALGNPNSASARVSHSVETGHLLDDIQSGKITEADVDAAGTTGIDVNGQHIAGWTNLSADETAAANQKADELRAAAQADPKMAASLESTKAAVQNIASTHKIDASLTNDPTTGNPAKGGSITESKHWWNKILHWKTIYINHAWLRGLIGTAAGIAAAAVCSFFLLSGFACAVVGAVFSGTIAEVIKDSASCSGKGLYIAIPDDWNSHCEV